MHTVSVKSSAFAASAPSQPSPQTPMKPPLVTVHSPGSVRSPPRSPRLSGLLLALKDVIGEDPEDEYDPLTGTTYVEEEPLSAYDTSETITVFNNHSFHAGIEEMQSTVGSSGSVQTAVHQPLTNDDDETLRLPSRLDDPEAQPSIYTTESSPDANSSAANPQLPSDLLSPTELSHLHLGSFIQGSTEAVVHDSDSIDSGYADTWRPPFPTSKSPPRNPLKSTFGVLSSPCGTAFSRVLSPRLSAFISRPPQSPFAPAIVDDDVPSELSLDSPAGDAFAEAEEAEPSEEYIVVEEDIEDAQDPVEDDSEGDAEDDPEEDGHDHDDDDCHTDGGNSSASSWDDQADPTAVYLGMPEVTPEEISIAIQRASRTPSHFLTNGVDLDFGEAVASSSMEIPAQDESLASEPLDPFIPVDDIFGEGVSSYIPASDVSFNSSVQPSGPIDDGFDGIPAQDKSLATEPLDPSIPVDDIFGEGVSSYIPASAISFNSSVQPSGPIDDGFDGIPAQEESFASTPLDPSIPVGDIFGEGVSSYIPASDSSFNSSAQPSGPIDDGFDGMPAQEESFAPGPLHPSIPVDDIFGEGVSSYIPASDVSFHSLVPPRGPIDNGFDGISAQDGSFAAGPLDPSIPVDDIFGERVSSYIPASDVSFNSSVQPSGPIVDGFDGGRGRSSVVFSSLDDSFNSESSDPSSPVYDDLEDDDADYIPVPERSFTSELRDLVDPVDDSLRDGLTNSSIDNLDVDDSFISELSSPSSPADDDIANYIPGVDDSYISEVQSHSGIVDDGFGGGAGNLSVDIPCPVEDNFDSSSPPSPADGYSASYIPGLNDSYISDVQSHSEIVDDSFDGGAGNSSVDIPSPVEDSFGSSGPPSPADDDPASYFPGLDDSYISDVQSHQGIVDDSFDGGAGNSSVDISSPVEDSFDEGDMSLDYTAQLAYLSSPIAINENDTLQYLYDQYSDLSEELEEQSANLPITTAIGPPPENPPPALVEIEPLSATTPMRSGFIRERVFTPPPTLMRGRSGTVITPADSPRSAVSPPVPYSSLSSQGRASPRSQSGRSAWSPDSAVSDLQEPVVSKKVPFGFRNSLAGRARASTFVPNRQSRRDSRAIELPPVKASQSDRASPSPDKITSASPVTGGLRPLRLSTVLSSQPASAPSRNSTFSVNRYRQSGISHRASISSISVLSDSSYSRNPILLSTRASNIPQHIRNTRFSPDNPIPSPLSSYHLARLANFSPQSAPLSRPSSWYSNPADVNDMTETTYQYDRPFSRASEPPLIHEEDEEDQEETYDHTIRRALPTVPHSAPISQRVSVMRPPSHAIVTPKPTLMFAIASDDVKQVRQVLQSGDAGPNDAVGPQSALAFALTNDQLTNKMEIVKTLLAFGADPKAVVQQTSSLRDSEEVGGTASPPAPSLMDAMDPATRYYVERADAAHTRRTSALIHRSFFRPLTRVRYELIGQDRALEQLFKDLSMHSRQLSVTPIVVLLCGPSGHGKSLLARKFGALLDVPTHTVDMTTIHSAQDLWKSYSMSPYDPPSTRSLAEFLIDNEGKRCVVVLDEIEKTHGESPLWALLMPWEHGRCTFEAHGRLVDVRNVVWLGTSNIGQDLVLEHHSARALPDQLMSREEYTELMGLLRPRVSERLGASMLSRVTTALPFVPFTPEERRAICFEALHTIAGDIIGTLSTDVVDGMVAGALANYTVAEGARSLYRAVSNQLLTHLEDGHSAP